MDRVFAEYYLQAGFTTCPITGEQIKDSRLVPVSVPQFAYVCASLLPQ